MSLEIILHQLLTKRYKNDDNRAQCDGVQGKEKHNNPSKSSTLLPRDFEKKKNEFKIREFISFDFITQLYLFVAFSDW